MKTSLYSFSNGINSDFSFSDNLELIKMGLGSYESEPRLIFSKFSSAITCTSFFAMTSSSLSSLLPSSKLCWATQHTRLLCCCFCLGPACISLVGRAHVHNLYTILPPSPQTLTHCGVSSNSAVGASFLFFFCESNSLRSGLGSLRMSSHLGTKVLYGFDTEPSPDGAHWL